MRDYSKDYIEELSIDITSQDYSLLNGNQGGNSWFEAVDEWFRIRRSYVVRIYECIIIDIVDTIRFMRSVEQ